MDLRRLASLALALAVLPAAPAAADPPPDPVQVVDDAVDDVVGLMNSLCEVDLCIPPPWMFCSVTMTLAPVVPPVVVVVDPATGDVVVNGQKVYDCPPYDEV
jgi:hypothetical protein